MIEHQHQISFIPYYRSDGIPSFPDSCIKGLYARMVDEGTASRVFCSYADFAPEDFLEMFKKRQNFLWVISVDGEISGVFWLNNFDGRSARIHQCLFRNAWGREKSIRIGRQILKHCIHLMDAACERFLFDVITGVTPSNNRLAVRFAEACGMSIVGEIPNLIWLHSEQKSIPGVISYATRESVEVWENEQEGI